jgi:hypothetical protein
MKEIKEKVKKFFDSKPFVKVLYTTGVLLLACFIFNAGVIVGFKKASFGRSWGEHYMNNFGGLDDLPNSHGAAGKIINVTLPTFIVSDRNNVEKSVLLTGDTKILNGRQEVPTENLKIGDFTVVIGSPNSTGQIEAKFIRVIPMGGF